MIIMAFHEAFSHDEPVVLEIAGDGPERTSLENLVTTLGEEMRINFTGSYSRNTAPKIFRSADVFVLTSMVEPFGIVYIEAMLEGIPCIGTKGQGGEDIINDQSGNLVEWGNIHKLAERMVDAYHCKWNHNEISRQCIDRFSQGTICRKIEEVYEEVII